jgi:hypothetical protein
MMYRREGADSALAAEWDHVRDIVLDGGKPGYVFFPKAADPQDERFHFA